MLCKNPEATASLGDLLTQYKIRHPQSSSGESRATVPPPMSLYQLGPSATSHLIVLPSPKNPVTGTSFNLHATVRLPSPG